MSRSLAVDRIDEIRRRLESRGSVTVSDLALDFRVSRETIRRDLKRLAELGGIEIVHGGATRRQLVEPTFSERVSEHAAVKALIAATAAALVPDNATLLLDSGSTTLAIARALAGRPRLTVATNSLNAALALSRGGHSVHVLGGELDPNDEATMSTDTIDALANFRFDLAFIGVGGKVEQIRNRLNRPRHAGMYFRAR